jgi:hypothetical protein
MKENGAWAAVWYSSTMEQSRGIDHYKDRQQGLRIEEGEHGEKELNPCTPKCHLFTF